MPKAKYEGIYRSIKKRIEAQDYPYQSLLPSENTLIAEYDCSRNTVRRAIAGADRRRLCAGHARTWCPGHLPAGGQRRPLPSVE